MDLKVANIINTRMKNCSEVLIQDFVSQPKWAVVGFSENPLKYGNIIFLDLQRAGYQVYPVNKRGGLIGGEKVYRSLADIPDLIDVVDVVVPPTQACEIVLECVKIGIGKIWLQPGAESLRAIGLCEDNGIQVIYNACAMMEKRSII